MTAASTDFEKRKTETDHRRNFPCQKKFKICVTRYNSFFRAALGLRASYLSLNVYVLLSEKQFVFMCRLLDRSSINMYGETALSAKRETTFKHCSFGLEVRGIFATVTARRNTKEGMSNDKLLLSLIKPTIMVNRRVHRLASTTTS